MDKLKLFRCKINPNDRMVEGQRPYHTHLISLKFEINGNVIVTPSKALSPNEFREVYKKCINDLKC
jgi:hypothetical protein